MLKDTITELIIDKLDHSINESAGSYYRSKNEYHNEFLKNRKKQMEAETNLGHAKKNSTTRVIRTAQAKLDNLHSESDILVAAASHHHGKDLGDAIRDHAHMALEPTHGDDDIYNAKHNSEFRKLHDISPNPHLLQVPPTKHKKDKKERSPKKEKSFSLDLLAGTALRKWFPNLGKRKGG